MDGMGMHPQGQSKRVLTSLRFLAVAAIASTIFTAPSVFIQGHAAGADPELLAQKPQTIKLPSGPNSKGALIAAGPSRKPCIYTGGNLQPGLANAEAETGTSPSCIMAYLNSSVTWSQWEDPWVTQTQHGYTSWVAASPQSRQLILQVDLIPANMKNINDPLGWEQSCASGNFDIYAQKLGTNLVSAGFENSVIRLGAEMNGPWESDFIGTTVQEQNLWATCFDNEVTALREVPGEHFLIDWNPNACYENVPYANYYPGNSYVDILGLDLYNGVCSAPAESTTPITWNQLATEPAGLSTFEAFAKIHGKPMSFPEWGLLQNANGDDPRYVNGIGSAFTNQDFAFETYFDSGTTGTLQMGPSTPLSLTAFHKWFGSTSENEPTIK
jgi:hypothetical protein